MPKTVQEEEPEFALITARIPMFLWKMISVACVRKRWTRTAFVMLALENQLKSEGAWEK